MTFFIQEIWTDGNISLFCTAWPNYLQEYVMRFKKFHTAWLQYFPGPVYIIHYEALKNSLDLHLTNLVNALYYNKSDKAILDCVKLNSEGKYHRKPNVDFDPFTLVDKYLLKKISSVQKRVAHQTDLCIRNGHCFYL